MCVCVCVCVCEGERERECDGGGREKKRDRESERKKKIILTILSRNAVHIKRHGDNTLQLFEITNYYLINHYVRWAYKNSTST